MRICQILWSMDPEEYIRLLEVTDAIEFPNKDEISKRLHERFKDEMIGDEEFAQLVDAELVEDLRTRYSDAAVDAGFEAGLGLAMLEYAAIIRDLDDGYEET